MANWGGGVSVSCTMVQLSLSAGNGCTHNCTAVPLAHANQLLLVRLYSTAGHESDSCKQWKNVSLYHNTKPLTYWNSTAICRSNKETK